MASQALRDELQSVRDLIEERFNTLTWLGQTRQNPIHANLTHKLIRAGYSPCWPAPWSSTCPRTCPPATPCAG